MSEEKNKSPLALEPHEREAFWYVVLGAPLLIASIMLLVGLTHIVLKP